MMRLSAVSILLFAFLVQLSFEAQAAEPMIEEGGYTQFTGDSVRVLLIPRAETVLSGEISGRIEKIAVDIGDHFKKGSILVKFNCSIYQSELDKAIALQKEAEKTLEVNKRLEKFGSISELEVAVAVARLDQARADSAINRHQVDRCVIHAPFSGGVVKKTAYPYQYITAGQPILEIIDTSNIDVQIHIPSLWIKKIQLATSFLVHVDEVDKQYQGVITAMGSRIDPVSQTLEIRGKINGHHPELLAGMSGSARLKTK